MTNFEKIKSMSVDELASFLDHWEDSAYPENCPAPKRKLCDEGDCQTCTVRYLMKEEHKDDTL